MNSQWKEVSYRDQCPICFGKSWCCISTDGAKVNCRREATGAVKIKTDKNGVEYYVHELRRLNLGVQRPWTSPPPQKIADLATLDKVYSTLLHHCPLGEAHRKALDARGIDDEQRRKRQYGTLLPDRLTFLAADLIREFGIDVCTKIPGFGLRQVKGGFEWTIFGGLRPALLVPSRGPGGKIEAIKVRPDRTTTGSKYFCLSSTSIGGPGPGARVHVPLFYGKRSGVIRVTEGELKADFTTIDTGVLTISVPGVSLWHLAIPLLKELGAKVVKVAFDRDANTNQTVARALLQAVRGLIEQGWEVGVEIWPSS